MHILREDVVFAFSAYLKISNDHGALLIDRLRSARSVGLLFSGGSSRCVFQVGVMETITELGIEPSACLGVSAGAWNAATVAAGNTARLRQYWRFFSRVPYVDLKNLVRGEHSPFIWSKLHDRAFRRYIGAGWIRSGLPLYVALTRLRDRQPVIFGVRAAEDPFQVLLASNYLPPFYKHPLMIAAERYGDGGMSNNIPFQTLFERGCDVVIAMAAKGESEGGLHRTFADCNHVIPPEYVVAGLGRLRAREVLLGARHPETDVVLGEKLRRSTSPGSSRSERKLPEACCKNR